MHLCQGKCVFRMSDWRHRIGQGPSIGYLKSITTLIHAPTGEKFTVICPNSAVLTLYSHWGIEAEHPLGAEAEVNLGILNGSYRES